MAYKLAVFEVLWHFCMIRVRAIPTYRVYFSSFFFEEGVKHYTLKDKEMNTSKNGF